ncbi:MAG: hypothetical protein P0Y55_07060 [Candidatus Cohnella colombiensis]|uniref:Transposase n=1 Tax=Candidatus Cohnella colombiensis TaxID=3121368 RepID=A0AA95EYF4_9BACL|nr:MAG: hypothetical protein P0Y55_07060 [Cohnella sp.]
MYHKIRNAMHQFDTNNLMTGLVRVNDETMYSYLRYKSENWHQVEQPIHVATSEDEMGNKQYLKIKVCPRLQAPVRSYATTTSDFLMKHVVPEARNTAIVNGGRFGIRRRTREMFNICYHAEKYLSGTYRGIGSKYLQVYLDEFTYIYNHKGNTIFNWLLRDCVTHQTITYPTLTCTPSRRSTKRSRSPEVAAKIG